MWTLDTGGGSHGVRSRALTVYPPTTGTASEGVNETNAPLAFPLPTTSVGAVGVPGMVTTID